MLNLKFIIISILLLFIAGCSPSNIAVVSDELQVSISSPLDDDPFSGSGNLRTIDNDHWHIHKGEHWIHSDIFNLGLNDEKFYFIDFNNKSEKSHAVISLYAKLESEFYLYESPTNSNNGTLQNQTNRNRLYPDNNNMNIHTDPTVVSNGDVLYEQYVGSGNRAGGEYRGSNEFVLNCSDTYLVRVVSLQASNELSVAIDWYD